MASRTEARFSSRATPTRHLPARRARARTTRRARPRRGFFAKHRQNSRAERREKPPRARGARRTSFTRAASMRSYASATVFGAETRGLPGAIFSASDRASRS
eukprot:31376-Pelagococcus_subviridis.AAC.24